MFRTVQVYCSLGDDCDTQVELETVVMQNSGG